MPNDPLTTPPMSSDTRGVGERATEILWHVEQVCGPLSTEAVENEGDDDRSVLLHNIRAVLATPSNIEDNPDD